jgi:hypothetical protein
MTNGLHERKCNVSVPIPSIRHSVVTAHREAARAVVAVPVASLVILATYLADSAVEVFVVPEIYRPFEYYALSAVRVIVVSLLQTPALISLYRYFIMGDRAGRYRFDGPRFVRFFVWLTSLSGLIVAAGHLIEAAGDDWAIFGFGVAALLAAGFLTLRLTLLFPAIAVDAPGAIWRKAFDDTGGHVFRILSVSLLAAIVPFGVLLIVAIAVLPEEGTEDFGMNAGIVLSIAAGIAFASLIFLFVAIAAGFYRWMARRVLEA